MDLPMFFLFTYIFVIYFHFHLQLVISKSSTLLNLFSEIPNFFKFVVFSRTFKSKSFIFRFLCYILYSIKSWNLKHFVIYPEILNNFFVAFVWGFNNWHMPRTYLRLLLLMNAKFWGCAYIHVCSNFPNDILEFSEFFWYLQFPTV